MTDKKIAQKIFGIMRAPEEIAKRWDFEGKTEWKPDSKTKIVLSEDGLVLYVWTFSNYYDTWCYKVVPKTLMRPEEIEKILTSMPETPVWRR